MWRFGRTRISRFLAAFVAASLVTAAAAPARAQEADEDEVGEEPGPAAAPDDDLGPPAPRVTGDPAGRRTIRGAPVPDAPAETGPAADQAAWERETFPPPGAAPATADGLEERPLVRPGVNAAPPLPGELAPAPPPPRRAPPPPPKPSSGWMKDLVESDLPVRWDARVLRYLEFYKDDPRGRALMTGWLRDQARYRDLILPVLRRHGLPEDLLYVCMIESAYNPLTKSRVGASGLWQFMPAAGRLYGLTIDSWVDERNDPEKATEAAALYWLDLYARFGDWDLALAAYNAGYGAVLKAIAKYNSNDFWGLLELENGLPWASSIYVPKAIAAAIVGRNRDAFGFAQVAEAAPFRFDRVTVDGSVSLAAVAKAAGASVDEIKALNPALRRGRTPPGGKDFVVRVPAGRREQFARTFPQVRRDLDDVELYVLRHGERFEDVAATYGLSTRKLRELNGVEDATELRGGTTIVVPKGDPQARAERRKKAEDDLYRSSIAPGEPGAPLIVPVPDKAQTVSGRRRVFYRVVAGDTLAEVAGALGVRAGELATWNQVDEDASLQPRMVLQAFVPTSFDADARHVALLDDSRLFLVTAGSAEHLDLVEGRQGRARKVVVAKAGDTLEELGKPHKLSKYDMARINRRSPSAALAAGEEVLVYVVVDRAKARAAGVGGAGGKKSSGGRPAARARGGAAPAKADADAKPAKAEAKPAPKLAPKKPAADKPAADKPAADKPAKPGKDAKGGT